MRVAHYMHGCLQQLPQSVAERQRRGALHLHSTTPDEEGGVYVDAFEVDPYPEECTSPNNGRLLQRFVRLRR